MSSLSCLLEKLETFSAFHNFFPSTSTLTISDPSAIMQTLAAMQPLMSQTTTVTSSDSQMFPFTTTSAVQMPSTTLAINTYSNPILTYAIPPTVTEEPAHQPFSVLPSQWDNILLATILNMSLSPNLTNMVAFSLQEQNYSYGTTQFSPSLNTVLPSSLFFDNSVAQAPISITPADSTNPSFQRRFSAPDATVHVPNRVYENRRYSDFLMEALLSPTSSQTVRNARNSRKQRTIYGPRQTEALEEEFRNHSYSVGNEREALAARLGLSEAQVRVWFQNRRSKNRKLAKDRRSNRSDKE